MIQKLLIIFKVTYFKQNILIPFKLTFFINLFSIKMNDQIKTRKLSLNTNFGDKTN